MEPPCSEARPVFPISADHAEVVTQRCLDDFFFVQPDPEMLQKAAEPDACNTYIQGMIRHGTAQMMCLSACLLQQIGAENVMSVLFDIPADFLFFLIHRTRLFSFA